MAKNSTSTSSIVDTPLRPDEKDFLEIESYVKGLTNFIEESDSPLTVAIQGEWGSGKSSFMNKICLDLCDLPDTDQPKSKKKHMDESPESKPFIGIWIRAWEYALLSNPREILINMLQGIITEIEKEVERTLKEKDAIGIRQAFQLARSTFIQVAAIGAQAAAAQAGIAPGSLANLFANKEKASSISALKEALEGVINQSYSKSKKELIFFIDDLDRLDPVVAVQFLELVKNIFDLKHCIFILAIDYDVVVKGLQPKFGKKTDENEREFRCFFDKIIQVPFSLPVTSYNLSSYLENTLKKIGFISGSSSSCKKTDPVCLGEEAYRFMTDTSFVPVDANLSAFEIITKLTELSTGTNPRSIKRLVNTLSLIMKIQAVKTGKNKSDEEGLNTFTPAEKVLIFALVCLQVAYPPFYSLLSNEPGFTSWNNNLAKKRGYRLLSKEEESELENLGGLFDEVWERFIYRGCEKHLYLRDKSNNISMIFNILRSIIENESFGKLGVLKEDATKEERDDRIEDIISRYIGLAGITGVNNEGSSSSEKSWNKVAVLADFPAYQHHLKSGGFSAALPLIDEIRAFLITKCGGEQNLDFEYKENNEIKVRPKNLGKFKGQKPNLMTLVPFSDNAKNTGRNKLKISGGIYENPILLPAELVEFKNSWPELRKLYNELSSVPLPAEQVPSLESQQTGAPIAVPTPTM